VTLSDEEILVVVSFLSRPGVDFSEALPRLLGRAEGIVRVLEKREPGGKR